MVLPPISEFAWDRPVAVLVGPHPRSAGDLNAFLMRSYPRVRFFGLPTNGSFPVPGSVPYVEGQWGSWYYQIAKGQMQSLLNEEGLLMHKGFPVDEEVWLTREGVARGRDDVVERALEWMRSTGVKDIPENLPKRFSLEQNYPNPFNPTTGVRYQVSGVSDVKLVVYALLGRELAVLVNERKAPGRYEVKFDGNGLASGVYLYRLTAGTFSQVRKMVLLR